MYPESSSRLSSNVKYLAAEVRHAGPSLGGRPHVRPLEHRRSDQTLQPRPLLHPSDEVSSTRVWREEPQVLDSEVFFEGRRSSIVGLTDDFGSSHLATVDRDDEHPLCANSDAIAYQQNLPLSTSDQTPSSQSKSFAGSPSSSGRSGCQCPSRLQAPRTTTVYRSNRGHPSRYPQHPCPTASIDSMSGS